MGAATPELVLQEQSIDIHDAGDANPRINFLKNKEVFHFKTASLRFQKGRDSAWRWTRKSFRNRIRIAITGRIRCGGPMMEHQLSGKEKRYKEEKKWLKRIWQLDYQ